MSPFEQITHGHVRFAEPTITIGKTHIGFNQACIALANLNAMKAAEIFWDEPNRVLKLKIIHLPSENCFRLCKSPASKFISCPKFVHRIKPKTTNNVPLHIPVRWDEKEKAFIGVVGKGKP